ncbi:MAG: hypothetical protein ACYSUI_23495 [Planctomycetota bacterium]|jgi:hypothetical protein
MDAKRFVIGTLVGAITLYVVGNLIWGLTFAGFFAANVGSATGVARDAQLVWAVALGNLALAALVTLAVGTRTGSATVAGGFKIGAIVGFLVWFGVDFIHYGLTNVFNLTATVVDPLLELIHAGIAGAVIAAVLGKIAESGRGDTQPT